MFYAHFVLSKKGPLARIWLAAHWDKKLTKTHVFETNIDSSVEAIIKPKVKMALRTTGHLLLGVVRIYSRKAKYLLADCNEAFVKIKMAFRPGVVDLPDDSREAAMAAITLPETFHDFETTMADLSDIDVQAQFSVNQSRPEEITMREDLGNITLVGDDGFGDLGFDDRALMHDAQLEDSLYKNPESSSTFLNPSMDDESGVHAVGGVDEDDQLQGVADKDMDIDLDMAPGTSTDKDMVTDDFGDGLGYDDGPAGIDDDDDDDNDDFGGGMDDDLFSENFMAEGGVGGLFEEPVAPVAPEPEITAPESPQRNDLPPAGSLDRTEGVSTVEDHHPATPAPVEQSTSTSVIPDQTTLLPNEAEAFTLQPLDITNMGTERRSKRKRKLIVDEAKGIPSETMKLQLTQTSEIVTTLDLAPPTKKLMHWKETGGVEKLFALPGRNISSVQIFTYFKKGLVLTQIQNEYDDTLDLTSNEIARDEIPLAEGQSRNMDVSNTTIVSNNTTIVGNNTPIDGNNTTIVGNNTAPQQPSILDNTAVPQMNDTDRSNMQRFEAAAFHHPSPAPPPMIDDLEEDRIEALAPPPDSPASAYSSDNELPGGFDDDVDDLPSPMASPAASPAPPSPTPSSVEDQQENNVFDEQLPEQEEAEESGEENDEDQEEKRWSKRTQQLMHVIQRQWQGQKDLAQPRETATFSRLAKHNTRKQAASKFYTLLVLKKQQAVTVQQDKPYGDILIERGPRAHNVF